MISSISLDGYIKTKYKNKRKAENEYKGKDEDSFVW
jgi:hypothetical protein